MAGRFFFIYPSPSTASFASVSVYSTAVLFVLIHESKHIPPARKLPAIIVRRAQSWRNVRPAISAIFSTQTRPFSVFSRASVGSRRAGGGGRFSPSPKGSRLFFLVAFSFLLRLIARPRVRPQTSRKNWGKLGPVASRVLYRFFSYHFFLRFSWMTLSVVRA